MRYFIIALLVLSNCSISRSQRLIGYKEVDTVQLHLEVLYPPDSSKVYPAMVFFFGGGWKSGDRYHFQKQAKYFAQRGLICFLADYRTYNRHQTTPFDALKDAKSAIRYIRKNASGLRVDASRIIASGGSAGGHLAAATALIDEYNESSDDMTISCVPNALVLFNPVIDNGPGGFGYERIGEAYKNFSPLHNIDSVAPPTLLLLGTADALIPVETVKYYQKMMERLGLRCDLKLYDGAGHGFFNYRHFDNYKNTVLQADQFLQSLGYLSGKPVVTIE